MRVRSSHANPHDGPNSSTHSTNSCIYGSTNSTFTITNSSTHEGPNSSTHSTNSCTHGSTNGTFAITNSSTHSGADTVGPPRIVLANRRVRVPRDTAASSFFSHNAEL